MMATTYKHPRAALRAFAVLLVLTVAGRVAGSAAAEPLDASAFAGLKRPVVVELYTSQGCNACPPADSFAGELAAVPGVLPLSFHVDYWDYIGWKDPFASPAYSDRQRDYAHQLSLRYVYTPQMVVDGRYDVVGFRRDDVIAAITRAAADQTGPAMSFDPAARRLKVAAGKAPAEGATLWLALYDRRHTTEVTRGENAGRSLTEYNVVRALRPLGTWTGAALDIPLDVPMAGDNDACAVLLQSGATGPVLSAAVMNLSTP